MNEHLEKRFFNELRRIRHLNMSGLTHNHAVPQGAFFMLHTIDEKGELYTLDGVEPFKGITVSELSEVLNVSKPAVSRMVNDLENKGMIQRILTKSDRRLVYVCLSDTANKLLAESSEHRKVMKRVVNGLGEEDTATLIRIMDKLNGIMEEIRKDKHDEKKCNREKGDLL